MIAQSERMTLSDIYIPLQLYKITQISNAS